MKKRKNVLLCVVFFVAFSLGTPGFVCAGPQEAFLQGVTLYRGSKFAEALDAFLSVRAQGAENGPLYYNIGNCYVQLKQWGRARLNYERARLFIPGDSDVRANDAYVQSLLQLPVQPRFLARVLSGLPDALSRILTIDRLTAVFSALALATVILAFGAGVFPPGQRRQNVRTAAAALACLCLVSGFCLAQRVRYLSTAAVIVGPDADVRFAPHAEATVHFVAPEGSIVEVLEAAPGWYKLRRPDGKIGWIAEAALEKIDPR